MKRERRSRRPGSPAAGIGLVQAQVRRQIGARMGGMFLDPISLARCEWTATKAADAEAA